MAQLVKNLPAMQETWLQSLDLEDTLEKGKDPVFWPGEFHGLYNPWSGKESDTTELSLSLFTPHPGLAGRERRDTKSHDLLYPSLCNDCCTSCSVTDTFTFYNLEKREIKIL